MNRPADLARTFHALHRGPDILKLPNAWDAGSARLMESVGAPAIATTSAGVAWAHGYPDGDLLPVELLVATVTAIARVVRVPLSVDMESGYSDDPQAVGALVARVVEAGAAGINIEDGAGPPDLLCAKVAQAKEAGRRHGIELFVNVRTDVYLRGLAPEAGREAEVLARAARYRAAGADGLFVPGLAEPGAIRRIAEQAGLPLNVLALPGLPAAAELSRLGVRRLSAGSWIVESLWGHAASLARGFLADGRSEPLAEGAMPYGDLNRLMAGR